MIAISCNNMIVVAHQRNTACGDGFLADVEVKEAAHLSGVVILERDLLEAPDPAEIAVKPALFFRGQRRVNGGVRVADGLVLGGGGHAR